MSSSKKDLIRGRSDDVSGEGKFKDETSLQKRQRLNSFSDSTLDVYDMDSISKCPWKSEASIAQRVGPHVSAPRIPHKLIKDSILDHIGDSPMIRINKIASKEGIVCDLVAKCEMFNAAGSVNDRIAKRMIEDAEKEGLIKPGDTLIEASSGNTGIGLALTAAIKGYRMIVTMPTQMSGEKVDILKALGAEVLRTPSEAAWNSPDSHIGVAKRLREEIPNSFILDQYANPSNPMAHYQGTAEEIWEQCEGKVDMVVMCASTGGTLTGVARRLKELNPDIIVVGVDPKGSILAEPENILNEEDDQGNLKAVSDNVMFNHDSKHASILASFSNDSGYSGHSNSDRNAHTNRSSKKVNNQNVEGIGHDFVPKVLDRSLVDLWVKTEDRESFIMARRLIREEGLLGGGACGAAMVGALKACKRIMKADQRCVVLLADSVRNFMSRFINDEWMMKEGFAADEGTLRGPNRTHWWTEKRVGDITLNTPITVTPSISCKECIEIMRTQNFDMVPVQSEESDKILGVLTEGNLTSMITQGTLKSNDPCARAMFRQFKNVTLNTNLADLAVIFDRDYYALEQKCFAKGAVISRSVVAGVVTRIDLLNYISQNEPPTLHDEHDPDYVMPMTTSSNSLSAYAT